MARGVLGTCSVCDLSPEMLFEVDCRWILGDPLRDIGESVRLSHMTISNHFDAGHITTDMYAVRQWMKQNVKSPLQTLERSAKNALTQRPTDDTPEGAKKRALDRLWVLEEYGINMLARMEQDRDFRGSFQGVDVLRKLVMDFARIEGLLRPIEDKKSVDECPDVSVIKESILDLVREKRTPYPIPFKN